MENKTVAVLGASSLPSRYSFMAVSLLQSLGYDVWPVNPREKEILKLECLPTLGALKKELDKVGKKIHTLTMYVNPQIALTLKDEILNLRPERVIFNPGAETPELYPFLEGEGIKVEEACTLVLLRTSQF